MLEKLEGIKVRWQEVERLISAPDAMSDMKVYVKLSKEYKELGAIVTVSDEYRTVLDNIKSSQEILKTEKDEEFLEMAKVELSELQEKAVELDEKIKVMLIPSDPEDAKNVVMEIRAGAGGDEASIFAGDLFRMYTRFCENSGWTVELADHTEGTAGGYKEVVFNVSGEDVYGVLKYESGVHRVQRVPKTETQGRVHTSAASVVVLPEADEFDVELKEEDIKKDTFCSSGPGGQSVNTTYSAIRLTHNPSGIVVQCQDQKSQIKNYNKALSVLRSRLYEMELKKFQDEIAGKRKTMVSTGDRSAKVRTYNFPQGRMTEHRINLTMYNLQDIMGGDIGEIIECLQVAENAERLREGTVASDSLS